MDILKKLTFKETFREYCVGETFGLLDGEETPSYIYSLEKSAVIVLEKSAADEVVKKIIN